MYDPNKSSGVKISPHSLTWGTLNFSISSGTFPKCPLKRGGKAKFQFCKETAPPCPPKFHPQIPEAPFLPFPNYKLFYLRPSSSRPIVSQIPEFLSSPVLLLIISDSMAVPPSSSPNGGNNEGASRKRGASSLSASAATASASKRTKNPGVRVVGGRIYDSEHGKTCHQVFECRFLSKAPIFSFHITNDFEFFSCLVAVSTKDEGLCGCLQADEEVQALPH